MRLIYLLILVAFFTSCNSTKEKTTSYPPIFINYAIQVLNMEFGHAVQEEEKISFMGRKIIEGDSTISELEILVKDVNKVPFENELPGLGQKIGIAIKTVLVDTNQYQRYKISYIQKSSEVTDIDKSTASIIIYAKDVESIPLNSSKFKSGLLKR